MQLKELLAQAAKTRAPKPNHALMEEDAVPASPPKAAVRAIPTVAPDSLGKRKESPTSVIAKSPVSNKKQKATATSSVTASNFLGWGAKKAKAALTARKMARAGLDLAKAKNRSSNTGSGVPLAHVMRLKHTKGFTQAVRVPCRLEDLA